LTIRLLSLTTKKGGGEEVMKLAAVFLLVVGCLWGLLIVWMFLTIAGVADAPESWVRAALYWGGMLAGPFALIIGAVLLLRGSSLRPGAILIGLGCVIFTGFALYNSITGMQRRPLEAPPAYVLYIVLLVVMLLSDAAAYKVYKALGGLR
jgi:small-conductance mechanosensitive channel